MHEVRLVQLDCNQTEDAETDELLLEVYVDGGRREPYALRKEMTTSSPAWAIDKAFGFETEIELKLWEEDLGWFLDPHDLLGTVTIGPNPGQSQTASFQGDDADYTLGYTVEHKPDTTPVEAAIADFEAGTGPDPWSHIDRTKVVNRVKHLVHPTITGTSFDTNGDSAPDQYEADQDGTPFCGPTSIMVALATRQSRRYVETIRSLFETGSFLGRTSLIETSSDLRKSTVPSGFTGSEVRTYTDSSGSTVSESFDRSADWMLLATLREAENVFFSVENDFLLSGVWSVVYAATPWEMKWWMEEMLGFRSEIHWSIVTGETDALKEAGTAHANDGLGSLLIDAALLDKPADAPFIRFPNHYITVLSDTPFQDGATDVDFDYQSWADADRLTFAADEFENYMYATVAGEPTEIPVVEEWLDAHTSIKNAIVWEEPGSTIQLYSSWSGSQKEALQSAFEAAWFGRPLDLADPAPNAAASTLADDDSPITVLAEEHAWPLYLSYIAHSLAAEAGGTVPWSVTGYTTDELERLFDSRQTFFWHEFAGNGGHKGYRLDPSVAGRVTPTPPDDVLAFLKRDDVVASDRRETIVRLLDWCRDHLIHFSGAAEAGNVEDQWQYRGYPPVSRILTGTPHDGQSGTDIEHRTAGCHGTAGFLATLLRVVNIPMSIITVDGHSLPHFTSEDTYLSHGDDPYSRLVKATPSIPPEELLIDQATFDAWFGAGVPDAEKAENVGRQPRELALDHLPNYLLHTHCEDLDAGRSHADSEVHDIFEDHYTVSELEARDLWTRMDAKIDGFGGCDNVPTVE